MSIRSIHHERAGPMTTAKVNKSPFFAPKPPRPQVFSTPNGSTRVKDQDEEVKSSVAGAAFNLINSIVGAGIVGIPFALRECSLVMGTFMVLLCAWICAKSLRLLIETAKHVDVPSYERLCEASFGRPGFICISAAMFIMAYGAMVGYLIVIKSTLPPLLGAEADDVYTKNAILTAATLIVTLPLCLQRDMSNLAKTSTISVIFDCCIVAIVATFSPVTSSLETVGGIKNIIMNSTPDPNTFFEGLGVLSFAFVCQHSAFIIAGSLDRPTRERWNMVTGRGLLTCGILATVMGVSGFLGFLDDTDGNILNNLGAYAALDEKAKFASDIARALLSTTMFFVYPIETFVARHVCVVLLFKGRRAHEGDDHSVLARTDRRVALTVALYIVSLVPALLFDDLGSVFAATGALGGSTLSYVGPGMCYLGVHGNEFLDMAANRWAFVSKLYPSGGGVLSKDAGVNKDSNVEVMTGEARMDIMHNIPEKGCIIRFIDCILWYVLLMPLWCSIAQYGQNRIQKHEEEEARKSPHPYRLGKVKHHKKHLREVHLKNKKKGADSDFFRNKNIVRADSIPRRPQTAEGGSQLGHLAPLSLGPPMINVQNIVTTHEGAPMLISPNVRKGIAAIGNLQSPMVNIQQKVSSANERESAQPNAIDATGGIYTKASDDTSSLESPIVKIQKKAEEESLDQPIISEVSGEVSITGSSHHDDEESSDDSKTKESTTIGIATESHAGLSYSEHDFRIEHDDMSHVSYGTTEVRGTVDDSLTHISMEGMKRKIDLDEEESRPLLRLGSFPRTIPQSTVAPLTPDRSSMNIVQKKQTKGKTMAKHAEDIDDDVQDDPPTFMDFFIAIALIVFGVIAAFAGLYSTIIG